MNSIIKVLVKSNFAHKIAIIVVIIELGRRIESLIVNQLLLRIEKTIVASVIVIIRVALVVVERFSLRKDSIIISVSRRINSSTIV